MGIDNACRARGIVEVGKTKEKTCDLIMSALDYKDKDYTTLKSLADEMVSVFNAVQSNPLTHRHYYDIKKLLTKYEKFKEGK